MSKRPPKTAEPKFAFSLGELLAIVFVLAYLIAFFRVELPNQQASSSGEGPLRRLEVLTLLTVPDAIGGVLQQNFEPGWVGERLYLLAMTGGYLLVAAALGSVLLRWLRPQVASSRVEQWVFALGLGLAALSLGTFLLGVFGLLYRWLFLAIAVAIGIAFALARPGRLAPQSDGATDALEARSGVRPIWLWILAPLVVLLLSGAMQPPIDFDVREYHLQAPKEFFQNGRINFLPHNVYANMPLGAEMHPLAMMVVTQDWLAGALVGKTIIACFALLTTAAIYSFGCRFFSRSAGIVAAIAYLSTPWVLLVSSSGLIDCVVGCNTMLAIYALAIWRERLGEAETGREGDKQTICEPSSRPVPQSPTRPLVLCGLMAGSALACKYPAVLFLALPIVGFVLAVNAVPRDQRSRLYGAGVLIAAMAVPAAPWFIKNWVLTGNPTYPLLYSVFGGKTRTPEKDAQWTRVHRPPNYQPADFGSRVHTAFMKSEWLGPAMMPLAIIGLTAAIRRRRGSEKAPTTTVVIEMATYAVTFFLLWWLFTHRIDRFLIPLLPIVSLLAGGVLLNGVTPLRTRLTLGLLALATAYAFAAGTFMFAMFNFELPYAGPRRSDDWFANPWFRTGRVGFNTLLESPQVPAGTRLLLVGDAQAFDYLPAVLYDTCFDSCVLEELIAGKSPAEAKAALHAARISYIYVDWDELKRYRSPGNYGYSPFPTEKLFDKLVAQGVLSEVKSADSQANLFRVLE